MVDRHGLAEVSTWKWEVWNELWGMDYPHPYLELYNASARALKAVYVLALLCFNRFIPLQPRNRAGQSYTIYAGVFFSAPLSAFGLTCLRASLCV